MSGSAKPEVSATGFAPHIEELHEFFRRRSAPFGKPDDLPPFVERLSKDESFRDEMASMVRAIIYRERDGLTPAELIELLITAVAGTTPAEDAPEPIRDAMRQMTGFAAGVFRSRWNPGGSVASKEGEADADDAAAPATGEVAATTASADAASRPMTPIFYQAQVVANGGEARAVADTSPAAAQDVVLPLRGTSEAADGPLLSLAGYAAQGDPVVDFLRTEGATDERSRTTGWKWTAAILAVVIAFCAGMFTRQWMVTRYGPAWPWHVPVAWMSIHRSKPAAIKPAEAQPPAGAAAMPGRTPGARRPAEVEAARSEWKGGRESAVDLGQPSSGASKSGAAQGGSANPGSAVSGAGENSALVPMNGAESQPAANAARPGSDDSPTTARDARVTAMVGASPALMESHLLFAPTPAYPNEAKIAHIQGPVVVETLVGRDGAVVRAHAISGPRELRVAAEEAVYGRRYRPYVVNDIPMAIRTLVTVNFPPR